ncbi:PQQ-dependent sugar dehydrogenase [Pacificimonas flava]|uniref:L-sorbosone dehydrogenase n=1 Tax=Pacificimonas flava TaxID=1234595 RepID=M2T5W7_9SPHN|nr:sorbosone dehydrogenase family protein [Pacificimonas flava]EMD81864.1 L-sorbosone dehydrogenase [Pacificimonas flava]MBB5281606.1 glucose/arabinose dehydrogenase [Pacificimonas flava]
MTRTILAALLLLSACGESANLSVEEGMGPDPRLPEPTKTLFPTVNTAEVGGWAEGEMPTPAPGFTVTEYAADLDHPRWLYRLPNGDMLVAETNKPPQTPSGIKGWIESTIMSNAGAGVESPNRITLLRDADGDGTVDERHVFLDAEDGLASPFGMAVAADGNLYVGMYEGLMRFPYRDGQTSISEPGEMVAELPSKGEKAGHWTRNVLASLDGSKLYISVGSVSNVGDEGMAVEEGRAAIHEYDVATRRIRQFAGGLRNPVGMAWNPASGELWTAVNERDALGSDLVPDYMTSVKEGGFYGWPYSYYGQNVDDRPEPQRPDLVERAIVPDYALGPHTASLGLAFTPAGGGAVVGQHGSWNREPRSGYQVVYVPFDGAEPSGKPQVLLGGFLVGDTAKGRPVGVTFDRAGALLVADDVGNRIWRVTPAG